MNKSQISAKLKRVIKIKCAIKSKFFAKWKEPMEVFQIKTCHTLISLNSNFAPNSIFLSNSNFAPNLKLIPNSISGPFRINFRMIYSPTYLNFRAVSLPWKVSFHDLLNFHLERGNFTTDRIVTIAIAFDPMNGQDTIADCSHIVIF